MKRLILGSIFIFCFKSHLPAQHLHLPDSVKVTLVMRAKTAVNIDSALVIFDKFNLNGAGTVYKMTKPVSNNIILDSVPTGKYYITLICFGAINQRISRITYITSRKKNNSIRFKPNTFEIYQAGSAFIPSEKIDPAHLRITRNSSFKP